MPFPSNLPSLTPRTTVGESQYSSAFSRANILVSVERRFRYISTPVPRKPASSIVCLPTEPEDAHITGATRSLTRRLLALNIRQAS
jgi:hypothetical protein